MNEFLHGRLIAKISTKSKNGKISSEPAKFKANNRFYWEIVLFHFTANIHTKKK